MARQLLWLNEVGQAQEHRVVGMEGDEELQLTPRGHQQLRVAKTASGFSVVTFPAHPREV